MNGNLCLIKTVFIALVIFILAGCSQTSQEVVKEKMAFSYDPSEFPGAKPRTNENFKNNTYNFQFVIN